MSKKDDKTDDKAAGNDKKATKDTKDTKGEKGEKGKKGGAEGVVASVAGHPRARAAVRRSKGWGGLIGFAIAAYLSHKAGVPTAQAALRALGAGIVGYILAWACAVTVWRHLVMAELRAAYEAGAVQLSEPGSDAAPDKRST